MPQPSDRLSRIRDLLTEAFDPVELEITDDSHKHAGHAGARSGGESHFRVEMVAEAFSGLSRIERQRMVYDLLAEELAGSVHALELKLRAPEES